MNRILKDNLIDNFLKEFDKATNRKGALSDVLKTWSDISKEWLDNTDRLKLYTNILSKNDGKEYICHFLEITSNIFGSSRPGNSNQYMIYRDNEDHYKNNKGSSVNNTDAGKIFTETVEPIFSYILSCNTTDPEEYISDLEDQNTDIGKKYNNYSAKQVIRKAIVLQLSLQKNNSYPLLHIYKNEMIDKWYKEFKENNEFSERIDSESNEGKLDSYFYKSNYIATNFLNWINDINNDNVKKFRMNFTIEDNITADCVLISIISSVLWQWYSEIELSPLNPNIILYGAPGTGKTYAVDKFLKINGVDKEHYYKVQFHPNYTYEDFIDGLRPCGITESGQIKFDLVNGHFKNFCIKAKNALEDFLKNKVSKNVTEQLDDNELYRKVPKFYFIVDEINRANLSSVFGETLTLLEANYRDSGNSFGGDIPTLISTANSSLVVKMLNNEKLSSSSTSNLIDECYEITKNADGSVQSVRFGIPKNLYFIGMMNDVDKSIDSFDLALRRRFQWIHCSCNYDVIADRLRNLKFSKNSKKEEIIGDYISSCKSLNGFISKELNLGDNYEFGHSFFMKISDLLENNVSVNMMKSSKKKLFDNFLRPTLNEYIRSFYTSEEEISQKLEQAKDKFISGSNK